MFHQNLPWIVSASDDGTIKVWDWQTRICICVAIGHGPYVKSAIFLCSEDLNLLVSASLDTTITVWDISGLRSGNYSRVAVVKHVWAGHGASVNWGSLPSRLPLILSEFGNIENDIASARPMSRYMPTGDSHQHTLKNLLKTLKREHVLFAAHPKLNLFAKGGDAGMIVFKLGRERPAFTLLGDLLYYVREKYLRRFNFITHTDVPVIKIKGSGTNPVYGMSFNPAKTAVLLFTRTSSFADSVYELYIIPKVFESGDPVREVASSSCQTATWVTTNRFAVLYYSGRLVIKNMKNEITHTFKNLYDEVFYAGEGRLLTSDSENVKLFGWDQQRHLAEAAEVKINQCRYVVWSSVTGYVALLSKQDIIICNGKLEFICNLHENARIKSGAWDESDSEVFVYTTTKYIKYILTNGDHGIIRPIDSPIYLTRVIDSQIFYFDCECQHRTSTIDSTEYQLKLALLNDRFLDVLEMIPKYRYSKKSFGKWVISYLLEKDHARLASYLVNADKVKFLMALRRGKIDTALEAAEALNDNSCWHQLAEAALWKGDHNIVEMCYQNTSRFQELSIWYLVSGNLPKFVEMNQIEGMRKTNKDILTKCPTSFLVGDLDQRIEAMMQDRNYYRLAYLIAATHGMAEQAERIRTIADKIKLSSAAEDMEEPRLSESGKAQAEAAETAHSNVFLPAFGFPPKEARTHIQLDIIPGSLTTAEFLLYDQMGVIRFEAYRGLFLENLPPQFTNPSSNWQTAFTRTGLRADWIKLNDLLPTLQGCYELTTSGKLSDAIKKFQKLLLPITLLILDAEEEMAEAQQMLKTCSEYICALQMETFRRHLPKRSDEYELLQCKFAAYFPHRVLQPVHQMLSLMIAVEVLFQMKNYKTGTLFARRLLDLGPGPEVAQKARKILRACKATPTDEHELHYNEHDPFNVCGYSYTPIYRGNPEEKCPLCGTCYLPIYKGCLCKVCQVAGIGLQIRRCQYNYF